MSGMVAGKVALVTGAGSGIGRASARIFAREGAAVVVSDLDVEGGAEAVDEIRKAGGEASFVQADVTRERDVANLIERVVSRFGRIDCAHNNAGVAGTAGALHLMELDEWSRVLAVNLTGTFLCMKYEIPRMLEQGGGAIVNTSSGAGVLATPGLAHYGASKHGVLGLTKSAALENATTGIRINAVCPGSVDTPMLQASIAGNDEIRKMVLRSQPGGRLGTPDEIAEAAVWLCSDRASFVTGESMLVDGGAVAR
jgi:NAD(P)-dependent dehydrogenase (short-subunit alcohol dehydrogenase family)